jgi:hypothetical protein
MLKLGKMKRTIALAAATLSIAAGATIVGTGSASAAIGCAGGDGCNHQTVIMFDGASYSSTQEWWGPYTVLKLQSDGNLVLYCQSNGNLGKPVWATNTSVWWPTNGQADFASDGNLNVWDIAGTERIKVAWSSNTPGGYEAIVQADGNFVIYNSSGTALGGSYTYHQCPGTEAYWG